MVTNNQKKEFILLRELLKRKSKVSLIDFINYINLDYITNWHHKYIANKIDDFLKSETSKYLMLFIPPQHGKSEIASRMLPAYALGLNPNLKIAGASYSIDLARSFNRDIQRIIESEYYTDIFPNTTLNSSRSVTTGNYLRNSEEFEIVNNKGSYKAVGVMGGLSGRKVDIAIIDDPVKDAMEAYSKTYRDRVWDWYLNVLVTRLHNDSKVLLIMTRWHEDDLAGRLLNHQKDKWEVLTLPAIKENNDNNEDIRNIGEPLWSKRHSIDKLNEIKLLSERTFSSLYQQRPAPVEGNIIKKEWFEIVESDNIDKDIFDLCIDTAYTKNTQNDPTAIIKYQIKDNCIYIIEVYQLWLEFPELEVEIKRISNNNTKIYIEPKASGLSVVQQLRRNTMLNVISDKTPTTDKISRVYGITNTLESHRVKMLSGGWNAMFLEEIATFPNATHDDMVDVLVMAVNKLTQNKFGFL